MNLPMASLVRGILRSFKVDIKVAHGLRWGNGVLPTGGQTDKVPLSTTVPHWCAKGSVAGSRLLTIHSWLLFLLLSGFFLLSGLQVVGVRRSLLLREELSMDGREWVKGKNGQRDQKPKAKSILARLERFF